MATPSHHDTKRRRTSARIAALTQPTDSTRPQTVAVPAPVLAAPAPSPDMRVVLYKAPAPVHNGREYWRINRAKVLDESPKTYCVGLHLYAQEDCHNPHGFIIAGDNGAIDVPHPLHITVQVSWGIRVRAEGTRDAASDGCLAVVNKFIEGRAVGGTTVRGATIESITDDTYILCLRNPCEESGRLALKLECHYCHGETD